MTVSNKLFIMHDPWYNDKPVASRHSDESRKGEEESTPGDTLTMAANKCRNFVNWYKAYYQIVE